MKTVLGYLRPYAGRAACGVLIKFSAAVLELILPLLLANVIDVLVPARDLPAIWRTGGLMLVLAFGAAAGNILANRMAARVSMEMTRDLRRDLYHQIQHLPCARADRYSASSLVSRLTNDTYNIHQMFDKIQRGGVRAPMLVLGGLTLTFLLEPVLALVQFCVSLLTFLTIFLVTRRGVPFYGEAQSAVDTVVRILRENAAGVRVIKALASQRREQDRFEQANRRDRAAEERAGRVMALTNPITDLLLNLGLTLVVLVGAVQVNAGAMPAGQIVAFLTYFALIQSATLGIAKVFVRISKGVASARRIRQVLEEPPTQSLSGADARRPELLGMEGATFSYHGVEPDLADVSFTLQKGQTLGILGPTGSGKTTLVSLLLRLYDADSGVVWVGGQDVRYQTPRAVQDRFGVAFQSQSLIAGTIYENIAFLRDLPRQDVEAAVDTAQAREFVSRLPQGLDTPLELRGANLSGGQRQRLLIARALAGRPEILVLDNADSALDYQTAARLWAALRRDFPRTTLVIISERVASVRDADCILVLEHGRILASGRHQDLLVSAPRYRKMAELQMGGETV